MHVVLQIFWLGVACTIVSTNGFPNPPTTLWRGVMLKSYWRYGTTLETETAVRGIGLQNVSDTKYDSKDVELNSHLNNPSPNFSIDDTNEKKKKGKNTSYGYDRFTHQNIKQHPNEQSTYVSKTFSAVWDPMEVKKGIYGDANNDGTEPRYRPILYNRPKQESEETKKQKKDNTCLELDLATTREKLNYTEEKASAMDVKSKSLESMDENKNNTVDRKKSWEKKYSTKIKILSDEKDRALGMLDQNLASMRIEKTRVDHLEQRCKDLEKSLSLEIENKNTALDELKRELITKYEVEMKEVELSAGENPTEFYEYKKSMTEKIAQVEMRMEEQKTRFQNEISRLMCDLDAETRETQSLTRQTLSLTRELKNAREYHGTLRKQVNKARSRTLFALRKNRRKSSEEMMKQSQKHADEIKALLNSSRTKEAELEMERDNAILQLTSFQMLNGKLEADMKNKTREWDMKILHLKEEEAESIARLEKEWQNRLKVAEKMAKSELQRIEDESLKHKHFISNEWSDRLQKTEKLGRKELETLMSLNREQLNNITTLQAMLNASKTKELDLEEERNDLRFQLNTAQVLNERLEEEMKIKTQEWEEVTLELKKAAAKEMISLEREWANRLKVAEDISRQKITALEEEATKNMIEITNKKKALDVLTVLNEDQLRNITTLQARLSASRRKEEQKNMELDNALLQLNHVEPDETSLKKDSENWQ